MIKERYCSREVSELLREKGFNEECYWYYPINGGEIQELTFDELNYHRSQFIKAPTHQMACDWLREIHKIFIEISVSIDLNGNYHYTYSVLDKNCKYLREGYTSFDWTYKDTVEEAIKYVLENLI